MIDDVCAPFRRTACTTACARCASVTVFVRPGLEPPRRAAGGAGAFERDSEAVRAAGAFERDEGSSESGRAMEDGASTDATTAPSAGAPRRCVCYCGRSMSVSE